MVSRRVEGNICEDLEMRAMMSCCLVLVLGTFLRIGVQTGHMPGVVSTPPSKRPVVAVDAAWANDTSAVKRVRQRPESQITVDEQVQNALYDHFVKDGYSWDELESARNSKNESLRAVIRRDKEQNRARAGSVRMGRNYWARLRAEFSLSGAAQASLKYNGSESPSTSIKNVLRKAYVPPVNREPLRQYCSTLTELNRADLVALLLYFDSLSPTVSVDQLATMVEIMRLFSRLGLQSKYPGEVQLVAELMDRVTERATQVEVVQNQRGTGMSPSSLLDMFRDYVGLVVSVPDLDKVCSLGAEQSVLDVYDELETLVQSRTGKALLSSLWKKCVEARLDSILGEKETELLSRQVLNSATLTELKREALAAVETIPELTVLADRRNVRLSYLGVTIEVQVRCIAEHIELFLECVGRTIAHQKEKLTDLPAQGVSETIVYGGTVAVDFISGALRTRRWLPELIADEADKCCGERLLDRGIWWGHFSSYRVAFPRPKGLIASNEKKLASMDKKWKLDNAYLTKVCADSETCVLRTDWMSCCLSSSAYWRSPMEAMSKSSEILASPLFVWSTGAVKADLKIADGWLKKLAARRPPCSSAIRGEWLTMVWASLPYFVCFLDGNGYFEEVPDAWPEGREESVQHGASAVLALAQSLLAKGESETTALDFELVGLFSHCLPGDVAKLCDARVSALGKASPVPVVALPPVAKRSSEVVKSKGRKRKSQGDEDAGEKSLNALLGL
eukprot:6491641-Amphidinium_carterae.2